MNAQWKYVEDLVQERPEMQAARRDSLEAGVEPISPAVGAQLAQLAAATGATQIVEIGTGFGVSALWLLTGAPEASLTSIDLEVEYQQAARDVLTDAGIAPARARLISGAASAVLPRMNDGSYDLVLVDADPTNVIEYVEHGLRIARAGGTVAVARAMQKGRVADPAKRDDITRAYRALITEVAASDAVVSSLSTAGDGLLLLTKRGV
jgi:predicted O-methyltransferase YrrM